MQTISYTPNAGDRNQYNGISNPGVVVTTGEANAAATITVDSVAAIRQGDWFAQQTSVDNSAGAVFASLDIEATQGADTDSITRKMSPRPMTPMVTRHLMATVITLGMRRIV